MYNSMVSSSQIAFFSVLELASALVVIVVVVFVVSYCLLSRRMSLPGVNIRDESRVVAEDPNEAISVVVEAPAPKLAVVWSKEKLRSELGKNWSCSVCLGENENDEALRVLPECGHVFHCACLESWLRLRPTCPLCRTSPSAVVCVSVVASVPPPAVPPSPPG